MPLTDSQCRAPNVTGRREKRADGGGLYLLVNPTGARNWRLAYRFEGKARTLMVGDYPAVSLAAARLRLAEVKVALQNGIDPGAKPADAPETIDRKRLFRNVAEEWFEARKRPVLDERTAGRQWARLAKLFPALGDRDIGKIQPSDVLAALRSIEESRRGEKAREGEVGAVYTARRVRGMAEAVFAYAAIPYGLTAGNPASTDLLHSLRRAPAARNHAALPFDQLPMFYAKLRGERCAQAQDDTRTRLAIELILHTVLRTHELRFGRWSEIRGDEWHIPGARMKEVNGEQRDHIVPLTPRAVEILKALKPLARGSVMIFPGGRPGHVMSENTMTNWLKAKPRGYQDVATIHGFRSMFSTHAHESGWDSAWIEMQLSHTDRDKVRGVYNKALYLEGRREMMAWWGEQLAGQESVGELL